MHQSHSGRFIVIQEHRHAVCRSYGKGYFFFRGDQGVCARNCFAQVGFSHDGNPVGVDLFGCHYLPKIYLIQIKPTGSNIVGGFDELTC